MAPYSGSYVAQNRALTVLCLLTLIAVAAWAGIGGAGWDLAVYRNAMHTLQNGANPYSQGIATIKAFRSAYGTSPATDPPLIYVYPPLTLPLLRALANVPGALAGFLYWTLTWAGMASSAWAGWRLAQPDEAKPMAFLVPVAAFFPGLLASGTVMGGNVAYLLYGAVMLSAVYGWKTGSWRYFYAATVIASCFKFPMIGLALIPALSAPRQWTRTAIAVLIATACFVIQPVLWPSLFRQYAQAVELDLGSRRDFGSSPVGLFTSFLYSGSSRPSHFAAIFYLCFALPLFALLVYLSRQYRAGSFTLERWAPTLLIGVILLNPRLIEYDLAPLTLPMALIAWRSLKDIVSRGTALTILGAAFALANAVALTSWNTRKLVECPLLLLCFAASAWPLLQTGEEQIAEEILLAEPAVALNQMHSG